MWLMLAWAAGTLLAFARTLASYAVAWRVRHSAKPFAQTLGLAQPVDVLQARPGSMPVTLWLGRSVILMPADAAEWTEERRRVVLLHELAHVHRRDALTHLLARMALAFYWWHPLAWTAWREFLRERERAADDLVLAAGARASDYASHLLEVARTLQIRPAIGWAGATMARRSQLEGRLLAILDTRVDRAAPGRSARFATALVAVALTVPLAAVRAQDSYASPADVDATIRSAQSQKNYDTLEAAAQAATQSKKYDVAQKLLEAALTIRAKTAGEQSVEYGVGLIKLAELEQKTDRMAGEELLAKAAQVIGDRPEAARALLDLGLTALTEKDYAQAFTYYQHAQLIDPAQVGMALMWMAVVRQTEKNPDEAERLYQSALAAKDTKPADSAVIMRVYSAFLRQQSREDEAKQFDDRASVLQQADAKHTPPLPAGVLRMGSGIQVPRLVRKEEPQYSEEARAAKLQGTVVLQVVIGTDGRARDARVLRELGLGLDENAIEAISQWEFKPGTKDGEPVPVAATIEVNFRLL
jgi:TonB family protein